MSHIYYLKKFGKILLFIFFIAGCESPHKSVSLAPESNRSGGTNYHKEKKLISSYTVTGFGTCQLDMSDFDVLLKIKNETLKPKFNPNSTSSKKLTFSSAGRWLRLSQSILPPTAPLINLPGNKRPVFFAIFDGTYNDRDDSELNQTVPATLSRLLEDYSRETPRVSVNYYSGVGTRVNWFQKVYEGITGEGTLERAEAAYREFLSYSSAQSLTPHVYAIGFSRGAASARHFLNLVDPLLTKSNGKKKLNINASRSFALLFDTVATGQSDNLNLRISDNTISVLHLIANDERRVFFPVTSVLEKNTDIDTFDRVKEYKLPGVHSDIGGGYGKGLETLVLQVAKDWLFSQGVQLAYENLDHRLYTNMGMNDSDWLLTPIAVFLKDLFYDDSRSIVYLEPEESSFSDEYIEADDEYFKRKVDVLNAETALMMDYALRLVQAQHRLLDSDWSQRESTYQMSLMLRIIDGHLRLQTNCPSYVDFDQNTTTILLNNEPFYSLTRKDLLSVLRSPGGEVWIIDAENRSNFN